MIFGKYINRYYLKNAPVLLLGLLALLMVDYIQLLIPQFYRLVINGVNLGQVVVNGQTLPFTKEVLLQHICLPMIWIVVLMVIGRFLWRICFFGSAVRVAANLRERMFDHSRQLSQQYYQVNKVGNLMSLYTNDIDTIQECFGDGILMFFDALVLGLMALYKMWRMDYRLTLLALIPALIMFGIGTVMGTAMTKRWEERQQAFSDLSDFAQENFSGIAVIKAFVKELKELMAFRKLNKQNEEINVIYTKIATLLEVLVTLFVESVICVILGYGGYLVYQGRFNAGQLVEYIGYFEAIVWPIMAISMLIEKTSRGKASLNRITELLNAPIDVADRPGVQELQNPQGSVEFRHLTFRYPDGEYDVLQDISFTIHPGESVGIVGKPAANTAEGGTVVSAADGIVTVEGMDRAVYGEIVTFENGAKGMVESVEPSHLGIMLFDGAESVGVGTLVTRTGKRAGIPVGEAFLGRVINPLGEPIDGKGAIEAVGYNPIEKQAPGILERQSVDTPLHTGILSIDSMFPIGRGQRELIIGDRQTGKTSIATDTILNQKDTGVLCIYVAIGQKASSIARVAEDLKKHGAMGYTTIVAATASDSAPLQYIAPYAGTALAEYFMAQGKSVLIVYDDLSKHAVAYRAISLLLRRSPGREAYPGDVFYLHSRLLERSCRMRDDLGGGSITALPIVETQAGDVSAYIPTNVISITDGQIFLETALFNAGNRPAVNVGLSVSRVGGAAQTKAMKKANANLRIELAQYKDMESFSQFSSDLDAETRRQLEHGKALMELLKQPLYQPKSDAEQVVLLTLAAHGVLDEIKTVELRQKTSAFVRQFRTDPSGVMDEIQASGKLSPEQVQTILNAWNAFAGGDAHAIH